MMHNSSQINSIVKRVFRSKSVGVLYNIPLNEQFELEREFKNKNQFYVINGTGPFTANLFLKRIGLAEKITNPPFNMLPALVQSRMVVLIGCHSYTPSFSRILEELKSYGIPFFIMMSNEVSLKDFRELSAYNNVVTIEQDFKSLKKGKKQYVNTIN